MLHDQVGQAIVFRRLPTHPDMCPLPKQSPDVRVLNHLWPARKREGHREKENRAMSVKLTTHQNGDVTIVVASGKLTMGEGASALRNKIRELVASGSRRIVLNLADVSYMDSSGLGELIGAHTTVVNAGGEIKLLNLAKRVHDLLKLTKLYTVFEAFEDEESAVASFQMSKPTGAQA
jgi:anti-sigma B factor antagonist